MGPFGQDGFAFVDEAVDFVFAFDDRIVFEEFDSGEPLFFIRCDIVVEIVGFELFDVFGFEAFVAFEEVVGEDIADPQAISSGFIHIGRADAFEGRTDFAGTFGGFRGGIDDAVGRQDQVGFFRDLEFAAYVDAIGFQVFDLFGQDHRIDDHAVTDDVDRSRAEDSGGNGMQDVFFTFEVQRMTGVGSALESCDYLVIRRQYVHDFAFAFIAPL